MKSRLCTRIAALFGNVNVLFFRLSILPSDLEHWSDPAAAEHPSSNISKKVCFSQIIKLNFKCLEICDDWGGYEIYSYESEPKNQTNEQNHRMFRQ